MTKEYVNSIGMKFTRVESGSFLMGVGETPLPVELTIQRGTQPEGDFDEKPNHIVEISTPFYIGIYEVTNFQYELFDPEHKKLRGKANVIRPMHKVGTNLRNINCRDTRIGLESLDQWLGDLKWDVIHFNRGLHDLCYRNPQANSKGNRDKINGKVAVPLAEYQDNLEELVVRLKSTGAVLVWAPTTFVPEGEVGRFVGDELKYNEKAGLVMAKHGIAINDLHALTSNFDITLFRKAGNVHYTKEGSQKIAAQVAEKIEQALKN